MILSEKDLNQIQAKGFTQEAIQAQLNNFKTGFPFLNIAKPATLEDGISALDEISAEEYAQYFERNIDKQKLVKFIPASGAATRMFKHLHEFLNIEHEKTNEQVLEFLNNIKRFPFFTRLRAKLENSGFDTDTLLKKKDYKTILHHLLSEQGLRYGNTPKGLIDFHQYADHTKTPFEEHILEGIQCAKTNDGHVNLHYTVSNEHKAYFTELAEKLTPIYEDKFNVKLNIKFSIQKTKTDTIAVDENLRPFRDETGNLLFRPGGHGALIENLNDINADVIFIKNIDNVASEALHHTNSLYKKALAGILIDFQEQIYKFMRHLEDEDHLTPQMIENMNNFLEEKLCVLPYDAPANVEENIFLLKQKFNRPIRVCGMVRNEGQPGGGPFWVINQDLSINLHIVESAQIDTNNPIKKDLVEQSTHFNPVDIICSVKDYKGNKFDLTNYIDHKAGFITEKTINGEKIVVQELPGLWNGSMSDWNTIFVEVPSETFNPVKSVNDLLKPAHLNSTVMI